MASQHNDDHDTEPSDAEILSWDAATLSESIRKQRISCQDLMRATLDRIDAVNPKCNAIVLLQERETLMAKAKKADNKMATQRECC